MRFSFVMNKIDVLWINLLATTSNQHTHRLTHKETVMSSRSPIHTHTHARGYHSRERALVFGLDVDMHTVSRMCQRKDECARQRISQTEKSSEAPPIVDSILAASGRSSLSFTRKQSPVARFSHIAHKYGCSCSFCAVRDVRAHTDTTCAKTAVKFTILAVDERLLLLFRWMATQCVQARALQWGGSDMRCSHSRPCSMQLAFGTLSTFSY